MEICYLKDEIEAGIDEAGRGCLSGRVYTAAVILPLEFPDDKYLNIIDSKKLNRKILQATLSSMHRSLDKLTVLPSNIIVDGTNFKMYTDREKQAITHQLIKGGDAKYHNIAAASILAKCYHDDYVDELLNNDPELEKYGWRTNMCYGTKAHMEAIKNYGITKHHRKSFKPCCDM